MHAYKITASKGSYWFALVFALIAIIGGVMTFYSPPSAHNLDVLGEEESVNIANDQTDNPQYKGYVRRTVAVTGFILIVFFIGVKWYQKHIKSDSSNMLDIEIIGRKYIAPKQYLLMVKVEDERLLLGVTDNSINMISSFNDASKTETIDLEKDGNSNSFSRLLNQLKIKNYS